MSIEVGGAPGYALPIPLTALTGREREVQAACALLRHSYQQMLRSTIQLSDNLLNSDERKLFRLLSLFVGGCSLEAIEQVCVSVPGYGALNVLEEMTSLIEKNLLQQAEQRHSCRFSMVEAIREYAYEQLLADEDYTRLCSAHARYYTMMAERAEQELGSTQQAVWLQRLELDSENVRAALYWLLSQPGDAEREMALRLASALKKLINSCEEALRTTIGIAACAWAATTRASSLSRPVLAHKKTSYPAGLTAREIEVLRLVARGMSDFQVAEQLIISHRTVHAHLSSIYSKLNVTSRGEDACFAYEHALL